jgi:hypothetical protein
MHPHSIWQGCAVTHLNKMHAVTPGGSINCATPRMKNHRTALVLMIATVFSGLAGGID